MYVPRVRRYITHCIHHFAFYAREELITAGYNVQNYSQIIKREILVCPVEK